MPLSRESTEIFIIEPTQILYKSDLDTLPLWCQTTDNGVNWNLTTFV